LKVLITGAGGFVGRHLASELATSGIDLVLTSDTPGFVTLPAGDELPILQSNITDRAALDHVFKKHAPDAVIHLAAVSHVVNAQNARETLSEINIIGTHNVCAAAASLNKKVKFLFVSTSLVYGEGSSGTQSSNSQTKYSESSLPAPESAYGASKLAGEFITRSYASESFIPYIVRPFNHIGPGQNASFVCPCLALKIATAPNGGTIKVGNLKTYRDFTDVRDVVRAYRLILQKNTTQDLFVVGSGEVVRIDEILNRFIEISGKTLKTEVDESLLRSIDPPRLCADPTLAKEVLDWHPTHKLENTLVDIYQSIKAK
jgi:GDP-4-dehydro-6-deoxy-D-mannose reductase